MLKQQLLVIRIGVCRQVKGAFLHVILHLVYYIDSLTPISIELRQLQLTFLKIEVLFTPLILEYFHLLSFLHEGFFGVYFGAVDFTASYWNEDHLL